MDNNEKKLLPKIFKSVIINNEEICPEGAGGIKKLRGECTFFLKKIVFTVII
jgi:hypothetical protein